MHNGNEFQGHLKRPHPYQEAFLHSSTTVL